MFDFLYQSHLYWPVHSIHSISTNIQTCLMNLLLPKLLEMLQSDNADNNNFHYRIFHFNLLITGHTHFTVSSLK